MASGWPGKGHGALLKNSIRARLWVHSAALEAPNRSFGDRIESHKRTLGSFSTGSCLLTRRDEDRPRRWTSAVGRSTMGRHGLLGSPSRLPTRLLRLALAVLRPPS